MYCSGLASDPFAAREPVPSPSPCLASPRPLFAVFQLAESELWVTVVAKPFNLRELVGRVRAVLRRPPGFVLLDQMLPDINGYEVCRRLRGSRSSSRSLGQAGDKFWLPCICWSGSGRPYVGGRVSARFGRAAFSSAGRRSNPLSYEGRTLPSTGAGGDRGIRTYNRRFRRPMLYALSYRPSNAV